MWVGELPTKVATIYALAFSPDNRTLYSGDTQGYVLAWDLLAHNYRVLFRRPFSHAHPGHRGVNWLWPTPDGRRLLIQDEHRLIDALHPEAGPVLDPGPGYWGGFRFLFPDGRRAAYVDPDENGSVAWWDLETGLRLPVPGPLGKATNAHFQTLLPDGVTLFTYFSIRRNAYECTNVLTLWDVRSGERVNILTLPRPGLDWLVGSVAPHLSADGRWVVFAHDKTLWFYDVPALTLRQQIATRKLNGVLAFHPHGRLLACVVSDRQVALYDFVDKRQIERFDWGTGQVNSLVFAPDGLTCAAGSRGKLVVWDVDT